MPWVGTKRISKAQSEPFATIQLLLHVRVNFISNELSAEWGTLPSIFHLYACRIIRHDLSNTITDMIAVLEWRRHASGPDQPGCQ